MIRIAHGIFFALAAGLAAAPLLAQDAPPACSSPLPLPELLAGWGASRISLVASAKASQTRKAVLPLGVAADADLLPTPSVQYPVQPGKPGGSVSFGGIFAFEAPAAGTYRVAINAHSWTDIIEGKAALVSSAHGRGPACTGITKMVDYPLQAGRHLLQIAANGDPKLTILVVRLP
ncbi:hypothetical protein BH10PSE12_BH10PSE12_04160 [soil metagenome]